MLVLVAGESTHTSMILLLAISQSHSLSVTYNAGLGRRRIYSILEAQEPVSGKRLLKMRLNLGKSAPWQKDRQGWRWTGEWSAGGPEWLSHPDVRIALDPNSRGVGPGEFWMSFEDWTRYFHRLVSN